MREGGDKREASAAGGQLIGSDAYLELVAERFRMLGEPMRLRLLRVLFEGEKTVGELVEASGGNQANISRHLQQLERSGILARRKEGLRVYYALRDPSIRRLCDLVCGSVQKHQTEVLRSLGVLPKG